MKWSIPAWSTPWTRRNAAGRYFRDNRIDLLIVTERYPTSRIPTSTRRCPTCPAFRCCCSSPSRTSGSTCGRDYEASLRDSGLMSLVQLVAGFRKMGVYDNVEVVVGGILDDEAYREIDRYVRALAVYRRLKTMTFGVIGHVFRGMFDFEYDKTMVKGTLGPEVIHVQIDHLTDLWEALSPADARVRALAEKVHSNYEVVGVSETDVVAAARVAVAMQELVNRFRLDGLALLGQHLVEAKNQSDLLLRYVGITRERGRVGSDGGGRTGPWP